MPHERRRLLFPGETFSIIIVCYCVLALESANISSNLMRQILYMRPIITRGLYTFYPIFEEQKSSFKELFL